MIRRVLVLLASVVLCFIDASFASAMDWGPSSLRLSEGMTEQQAIAALGYQPSRAEVTTCGRDTTSGEWDCRVLTFGNRRNNLVVYERREDESWIVNSWRVFPDL
jgi:hypothetical protein